MTQRRLVLLAPAGLLAAGLIGVGAWWAAGSAPGATRLTEIGGPFRLVDGNGHGVTDQSFRGKAMLVYFGYTHCPDACPTALQDLTAALDKLPPEAREQARIVFITVDPERDTPDVMKSYAGAFGPEVVGLTGSREAVAEVARGYRVYYARHAETGGGYSMDHSGLIYLMDKDGRFVSVFTPQATPDEMAGAVRKLVG